MARIMVTGAGGFIGAALCPALAARGHQVVAGLRRPLNLGENIAPLVLGELSPNTDWSAAALGRVESVIHLAQRAHTGPDPAALATEHVTVAGLIYAMAAVGARRLVLVSSVKAMGERTAPNRPFRPDGNPRPEDAYGRAKLASEQTARAVCRDAGVELVIIRPPLVYGPAVKANFAALLRLVRSGLPLPFAAIDNRRSLIARDNLVDLLGAAAVHPAAAGMVLLARDNEDFSTPALIRALAAGLGREARLFAAPRTLAALRPLPVIGPRLARLTQSLQVDDSATRTALGWAPPVPAETALAATARAFAERL